MARTFTPKEVDELIEAAVAKATSPLLERISELEAELSKAKKNSSNSSKPPSSDIVKPKKPKGKRRRGKRKQGGQPGHAKHERPEFPPEVLDSAWEYHLSQCPACGDVLLLLADEAPRTIQQVEVMAKPIRIEAHRGLAYWCATCQKVHYSPLPPEVQRGGLFGSRLTAVVAYMKGMCHASFSTIRKFLRDVVGVTVSRGYLRKLIAKITDSLDHAYEELLSLLPGEDVVNVDETGHKEKGQRFWTWCFRERGQAYFEFITRPNVEPTNNIAEQAIRFVVIDRRITQGTRGETGRRWCERIWTTLATCDRTGRDVLDFLHQTLLAYWHGLPPPSLLETDSA